MRDEWKEWLASRPPHVRRVAEQCPPGTYTVIDGRELWLLSYVETDAGSVMIRFSTVNPADDYDAALASEPIYLCAEHFTPPQWTPHTGVDPLEAVKEAAASGLIKLPPVAH